MSRVTMPRLNYYRAALYLCAVIALSDAIWVLFYVPRLAAKDTRWVFEMALAAAVITPLGLLIRSNFIRWLGGVFMVFWAVALLWPLISDGTAQFSRPNGLAFISYYGVRGALSLLTAYFCQNNLLTNLRSCAKMILSTSFIRDDC
jgi:hypothetical protein